MFQAPSFDVERPAPACPIHVTSAPMSALSIDDVLVLPMHKRMVVQYADDGSNGRELRLYYGSREIVFDEPELFGFGETLAKQSRFVARDALSWSGPHAWTRISGLLEDLIDQGVLRYDRDEAGRGPEKRRVVAADGDRPSPLALAKTELARGWLDSDDLMRQLTGTPLDVGHLELVVPIFRVVHLVLDADGRQVGEANVFPPDVRLDVPTRWRACIYEGTRHQSDRPMNVTALKSMRAHWGTMMAIVLRVREAYLKRFPEARNQWTVGHLERLSTAILALPTLLVMRTQDRVENGTLHPALSSLFRVTDGVRMTMHQMLFVPVGEPTLSPDAPMSAAEIYAYAERNYSFHSEHGVCAGPKAMIEEFLAVLVDGRAPKEPLSSTSDPQIIDAIASIESAVDYALLGLQAYAVVFSLWPLMARTYERLAATCEWWGAAGSPRVVALRDRLRGHIDRLKKATYLANESWRVDREQVYADMFAQCGFGLTGMPLAALDERLASNQRELDPSAVQVLRESIARHFDVDVDVEVDRAAKPYLEELMKTLVDFFTQQQAMLRVALRVQAAINRRLGRTEPTRSFTARDFDLHNQLLGSRARHLPYLVDEIEDLFGLRIDFDADAFDVIDTHSTRRPCAVVSTDSGGIRPTEPRAESTLT